jgi:hypothetical protein
MGTVLRDVAKELCTALAELRRERVATQGEATARVRAEDRANAAHAMLVKAIAKANDELAQAKALGAEWEGKYERAVQTVQYQDEVILKLKAKLREKVSGVIVVDRAPKKPIAGAVKPKEPTT